MTYIFKLNYLIVFLRPLNHFPYLELIDFFFFFFFLTFSICITHEHDTASLT